MYAVIEDSGLTQIKVAEGDEIKIDPQEAGRRPGHDGTC